MNEYNSNEEHYISSGYAESIRRISDFFRLAQEARMRLGDGEDEDLDAKAYKEALDGLFIELSCVMDKDEFDIHDKWRKETDKFRFTYSTEEGSPTLEEGWYDSLREWHFELVKSFQNSGMNFPINRFRPKAGALKKTP